MASRKVLSRENLLDPLRFLNITWKFLKGLKDAQAFFISFNIL